MSSFLYTLTRRGSTDYSPPIITTHYSPPKMNIMKYKDILKSETISNIEIDSETNTLLKTKESKYSIPTLPNVNETNIINEQDETTSRPILLPINAMNQLNEQSPTKFSKTPSVNNHIKIQPINDSKNITDRLINNYTNAIYEDKYTFTSIVSENPKNRISAQQLQELNYNPLGISPPRKRNHEPGSFNFTRYLWHNNNNNNEKSSDMLNLDNLRKANHISNILINPKLNHCISYRPLSSTKKFREKTDYNLEKTICNSLSTSPTKSDRPKTVGNDDINQFRISKIPLLNNSFYQRARTKIRHRLSKSTTPVNHNSITILQNGFPKDKPETNQQKGKNRYPSVGSKVKDIINEPIDEKVIWRTSMHYFEEKLGKNHNPNTNNNKKNENIIINNQISKRPIYHFQANTRRANTPNRIISVNPKFTIAKICGLSNNNSNNINNNNTNSENI